MPTEILSPYITEKVVARVNIVTGEKQTDRQTRFFLAEYFLTFKNNKFMAYAQLHRK